MIQVAVLPTSVKSDNIFSYLSPLIQELKDLEDNGITVSGTDGITVHARAHLLLASGDIPGISALCNHGGHQCAYGCRVCRIRAERLQSPSVSTNSSRSGYAQYFPGSEYDDELRTKEDFMRTYNKDNQDLVSLVIALERADVLIDKFVGLWTSWTNTFCIIEEFSRPFLLGHG